MADNPHDFRPPSPTDRVSVMGSTGSGKTQFAFWLLTLADFDTRPFIIVDFKRDALLNSSDRIREIDYKELPKHPGVYILHPLPTEQEAIDAYLLRAWERENVGLFFDEAYMLPDKAGLSAVLTQGRSKRIPVISLTQRPAWISRFIFSEASHYAVFHLNDRDDRKKVKRFIPDNVDIDTPLPAYHSWWYTVGKHTAVPMLPVPDEGTLLEQLDARLTPRQSRRVI